MKTYVAFLRGINIGGRNKLAMTALVTLLEGLGCRNVKTYIQTGNVALHSSEAADHLAKRIGADIKTRHGFEPHVLLLELQDFERAIAANPFPEAENDPRGLHFGFLDAAPAKPDLEGLSALAAPSERFRLIDKVFYLHAPNGVGRSRLAARSEQLLGVAMTDRNWRTVRTLRDMVRALP